MADAGAVQLAQGHFRRAEKRAISIRFCDLQRHAINPMDKVLPLPSGMAESMHALLFQADQLTGQLVFWADTVASLQRLGLGLGIATLSALLIGLVLAHASLVANMTGATPVLLLDEVVAPLDRSRRAALFAELDRQVEDCRPHAEP